MHFPPLAASCDAEVVVIGAGVAGAAVAFQLARGRRRVVLLEAGTLAPGADVGHVRVGLGVAYSAAVRSLGRDAAREIWERQRESRLRLEGVLRMLESDCDYRHAGGFRLAESRQEGITLAESEELLREDGFSGEFFDHHMLEARFDVQGFAAGYWAADDADLDVAALLGRVAVAAQQLGAAVHEQSAVAELELSSTGAVAVTRQGAQVRAGLAVLAAGAGSGQLVPWLATRLVVAEERQLGLGLNPAAALPSPGSARDGRVAWRAARDLLLLRGARPQDFVAGRFLAFPGVLSESRRCVSAGTRDGLALAGWLPERPSLIASGFGGDALGSAFQVAHWIAEAVAGRDVVPPGWRADREAQGGGS